MSEQIFDVLVVGGGPAGYIAAIRAAQLGFKVACADKWIGKDGKGSLGGTCLNVGCIPSKALLASSETFENIKSHSDIHGISAKEVSMDVNKMQTRKDGVVKKMTGGIEFLFRKNKVTWLQGAATLTGKHEVGYSATITTADGAKSSVAAKHLILATGSSPRNLPGLTVDNQIVCDNEGALAFDKVPKTLGVIGAGVIGLELGSVWRRLGSDVTILEAAPTFLAAADEAIAKEAFKQFTTNQGLKINLGVKLGDIKVSKKGVEIPYLDADGKTQTLSCERLIVSVGRIPHTTGLGLESIGIKTDERGFIPVDQHCKTLMPNVYAIGDVVRGPMLAHKGEEEGVMVAEIIAGQAGHVNYDTIPWVIYTSPEIAWVGKTEQELKKEGVTYKVGQFPFLANGRALGQGDSIGFVKVLADQTTDRVLGVHVINAHASDLVSEAVMAMEFVASSEDIARICHAHPSLAEVMKEAALACDKRALNM
jgi:dihydrolipoamide dehydrogenase